MVTGSHSDSIVPLDRNHSSSITSSSSSSSSSSSMDDVCACSHGFIDFSTECTRCFGKTKESNHETNQVQVNDYSSSSSIQDQRTSTNRVEISAADSNSSIIERYCFCGRGFDGDMIACDRSGCNIEWYHFECVGLVKKPKGRWYCPPCRRVSS
mmetsp:Transcript_7320/g.10913  ORF Transcript_7320/g.10913 Transcript_7320/m.10913 type:complete len:154 (+) Transcript_7320:704-1165(+)